MTNKQTPDLPKAEKWHVDKGIPIVAITSVILGLAIQGFAFSYKFGVVENRIDTLEAAVKITSGEAQRITRVETEVSNLKDDIREIKDDVKEVSKGVRRIEERLAPPRPHPSLSGGGR